MNQNRKLFINELVIRIMAMFFMTLDHVGLFMQAFLERTDLVNKLSDVFRYAGRIAFPLFIFMVAEAIRHTSNKKRYILRLLIMTAVIALSIVIIAYTPLGTKIVSGLNPNSFANPFIDIFVAACFLCALSLKGKKKLLAIIPFAFAALSHGINVFEWNGNKTVQWLPLCFRDGTGLYGIGIALGFYFAKPLTEVIAKKITKKAGTDYDQFVLSSSFQNLKNLLGSFFFFAWSVTLWGLSYLPYDVSGQTMRMGIITYGLLSILPLMFYNGKRGPDGKGLRIFSYLYYPLHIILLFLIFGLR